MAIVNGPNLNLLGKREPGMYGSETFEAFLAKLRHEFDGHDILYRQSNVEGELINILHALDKEDLEGILLNAGGYTHTSVALGDAVAAIATPVVEVHISNIFARKDFRHVSFIGPHCKGSISGFGLGSYRLGAMHFLKNA